MCANPMGTRGTSGIFPLLLKKKGGRGRPARKDLAKKGVNEGGEKKKITGNES